MAKVKLDLISPVQVQNSNTNYSTPKNPNFLFNFKFQRNLFEELLLLPGIFYGHILIKLEGVLKIIHFIARVQLWSSGPTLVPGDRYLTFGIFGTEICILTNMDTLHSVLSKLALCGNIPGNQNVIYFQHFCIFMKIDQWEVHCARLALLRFYQILQNFTKFQF